MESLASVDELSILCILSKQVTVNGECAVCHDRLKTQDNIAMGDNEPFSSSTEYRKNLRYCGGAPRGMAGTARYSNAVLRHPHLVFCSVAHDPFEVDVLLFQLIKLGAYRMDCKKMS